MSETEAAARAGKQQFSRDFSELGKVAGAGRWSRENARRRRHGGREKRAGSSRRGQARVRVVVLSRALGAALSRARLAQAPRRVEPLVRQRPPRGLR